MVNLADVNAIYFRYGFMTIDEQHRLRITHLKPTPRFDWINSAIHTWQWFESCVKISQWADSWEWLRNDLVFEAMIAEIE